MTSIGVWLQATDDAMPAGPRAGDFVIRIGPRFAGEAGVPRRQGDVQVFTPRELANVEVSRGLEAADAIARYLSETLLLKRIKAGGPVEFVWPEEHALQLAVAMVTTAHPETRRRAGQVTGSPLGPIRQTAPLRSGASALDDLLGQSPAMVELRRKIQLFAPVPYPVLIEGETGSGKELVARALHSLDATRSTRPFIAANGAILRHELAESELFGHVRGAFTGADRLRVGRLQEAEGGTFFLDELHRTHPAVQGMLLRAFNHLDRGSVLVSPLGGQPKDVALRVVVALHDARAADVPEDLLQRVGVLRLEVPPLRQHPEDIEVLFRRFLPAPSLDVHPDVWPVLRAYAWPGNVRELRNTAIQAAVACGGSGRCLIEPQHLPPLAGNRPPFGDAFGGRGLEGELAQYALAAIHYAETRYPDNGAAAARALGFQSKHELDRKKASYQVRLQRRGGA